MAYSQQTGGMRPTRMHSCFVNFSVIRKFNIILDNKVGRVLRGDSQDHWFLLNKTFSHA